MPKFCTTISGDPESCCALNEGFYTIDEDYISDNPESKNLCLSRLIENDHTIIYIEIPQKYSVLFSPVVFSEIEKQYMQDHFYGSRIYRSPYDFHSSGVVFIEVFCNLFDY